MIYLSFIWRQLIMLTHPHTHPHTYTHTPPPHPTHTLFTPPHPTPHTHTHTLVILPMAAPTFLSASTHYNNCRCDSWQQPCTSHAPPNSTSTTLIINSPPDSRGGVHVRVRLWVLPSIHYELIPLVSVVFLEFERGIFSSGSSSFKGSRYSQSSFFLL